MQQIWLFQDIPIFSKGGHCVMEVGAWSYTMLKRDHSITTPAQFELNLLRDRSQNLGDPPPPTESEYFVHTKKRRRLLLHEKSVRFLRSRTKISCCKLQGQISILLLLHLSGQDIDTHTLSKFRWSFPLCCHRKLLSYFFVKMRQAIIYIFSSKIGNNGIRIMFQQNPAFKCMRT